MGIAIANIIVTVWCISATLVDYLSIAMAVVIVTIRMVCYIGVTVAV